MVGAYFEKIICDYVSALSEVKKVKNRNKRACLYYDAQGYEQDMIAYELHLNQSTVSRNLDWLKNFFAKECIKSGV